MQHRLGKLTKVLDGNAYLNGESLSAADVYAYIVLSWSGYVSVTLPAPVQAYFDGLVANPEIQKAQAAMVALQ